MNLLGSPVKETNIKKTLFCVGGVHGFDIDSTKDINLERLLLAQFEGGCELPFGAYCRSPKGDTGDINLFARLELDKELIEARVSGKNRQIIFKKAMVDIYDQQKKAFDFTDCE